MTPPPDAPRPGSFAALFEAAPTERARQYRVGDTVRARVVLVARDALFVELDAKRQAEIPLDGFRAGDGSRAVAVGDEIEVSVLGVDETTGDVRLGRSLGRVADLEAIEAARETGLPIEGKVTGLNRGGLEVDLGGARAFCPASQVALRFAEDLAQYVGRTLEFAVLEVREGGKRVVLSRRRVLEAAADRQRAETLASLAPGAVVRGVISAVRPFGAFVDLGGVEGLIPTSELSHVRGGAARDVVSPGDTVEVLVREVREAPVERPGDRGYKIALSLKALAPDPWDAVGSLAPEGRAVQGVVRRIADFGAFVELAPGIDGLLHASELGAEDRARLAAGQTLTVVVKSVDRAARRIALTLAPDGTAVGAQVGRPALALGALVDGAVDHVEPFGVFVQVDGTRGRDGRGLVPNAELGVPRGADVRKLFPPGTKVRAKVLETGTGRLRLSLRAVREDEERADYEGYRAGVTARGFGTLGDLFRK